MQLKIPPKLIRSARQDDDGFTPIDSKWCHPKPRVVSVPESVPQEKEKTKKDKGNYYEVLSDYDVQASDIDDTLDNPTSPGKGTRIDNSKTGHPKKSALVISGKGILKVQGKSLVVIPDTNMGLDHTMIDHAQHLVHTSQRKDVGIMEEGIFSAGNEKCHNSSSDDLRLFSSDSTQADVFNLDDLPVTDILSVDASFKKKKQVDPNALMFLEPLFRYFKMVCESDLPFPGFRCGPGGSVSHRRPFLSGRFRFHLKKIAMEKNKDRAFTSPPLNNFGEIEHKVNTAWRENLRIIPDTRGTESFLDGVMGHGTVIEKCDHLKKTTTDDTNIPYLISGSRSKDISFDGAMSDSSLWELSCAKNIKSDLHIHMDYRQNDSNSRNECGGGVQNIDAHLLYHKSHQYGRTLNRSDKIGDFLNGYNVRKNRGIFRPVTLEKGHHRPSALPKIMFYFVIIVAFSSAQFQPNVSPRKPTKKPVLAPRKPTKKPVVVPRKQTNKPVVAPRKPTNKPVIAPTKPIKGPNTVSVSFPNKLAFKNIQNLVNETDAMVIANIVGDSLRAILGSAWSVVVQRVGAWDVNNINSLRRLQSSATTYILFVQATHIRCGAQNTCVEKAMNAYTGSQSVLTAKINNGQFKAMLLALAAAQNVTKYFNGVQLTVVGECGTSYALNGVSIPLPSCSPTRHPTAGPTAIPTSYPTASPTASPTAYPTASPTTSPTAYPTAIPTAIPTANPTASPTVKPTYYPAFNDITIRTARDAWITNKDAATLIYGPMALWDVSRVTDMTNLFSGSSYALTGFNEDLSMWDTGRVKTMSSMFEGTASFNGDLSSWDVSSVTDMSSMFWGCTSFNGDLSSWNVSSVRDMNNMFRSATSFNADLSSWDVSSVTVMVCMFIVATSFNGNVSSWDVSSVRSMTSMFYGASSFNGDLSSWNVSSVTSMQGMFQSSSFNGDLSSWDVSSVDDMGDMFYDATSFNGNVSSWDVSSVTDMQYMFRNAASFDGNVSSWDVSSVTDMSYMFRDTDVFNGDLSLWQVSSVTDMQSMFRDAKVFNHDLSSWNVSSVRKMGDMFSGASSFNGSVSSWRLSSVTNMSNMFNGASSFNGSVSSWRLSSVTNMSNMFNGASSFNGNVSSWNVSSVRFMQSMFRNATSFNGNVSSWVVSSVRNMDYMFYGATLFNQKLCWNTASLTSSTSMFTDSNGQIGC
jgi:surface protein